MDSRRLAIFIVFIVFGLLAVGPAGARDSLVLVSVPWQKTETLEEIYAPLVKLLEQGMGQEVKFFVAGDYQELGKRMDTGAADIGIFGGNAYVEAKSAYPRIQYLATCMQPTAFYRSLVITRKDSGITGFQGLKGKSFGFTDKKSTSGYLYPLLMLRSNLLQPDRDFRLTYFLKAHDKVYDAVAKGTIDAGGASLTALEKAIARNGEVFRIIAESDPIPRNAVTAAGHLSQETVAKLTGLLAGAARTDFFKQSGSILKGFRIESDAFYDIVRKARALRE